MTLCYLGLGSNLRVPQRQLRQSIGLLNKLPKSVITKISKVYNSRPWGVRSQPHYCNMVIALRTSLSAHQLLRYCKRIEQKNHRIQKKHWGARTIDIDLLLYGEHVINNNELIVPHPHMLHRDFVLVPLLEIAPQAHLPSGEPIMPYLKRCESYIL